MREQHKPSFCRIPPDHFLAGRSAATYDLVIKGGRVIDPSVGLDAVRDVAIVAGKIAAVEADISGDAADIIDARGKIVAPGLIDIHTHAARVAVFAPPASAEKINRTLTKSSCDNSTDLTRANPSASLRAKVSATKPDGSIPTTFGGKLPPVSVLARREFGLRPFTRPCWRRVAPSEQILGRRRAPIAVSQPRCAAVVQSLATEARHNAADRKYQPRPKFGFVLPKCEDWLHFNFFATWVARRSRCWHGPASEPSVCNLTSPGPRRLHPRADLRNESDPPLASPASIVEVRAEPSAMSRLSYTTRRSEAKPR
jgi:hypothetical protein